MSIFQGGCLAMVVLLASSLAVAATPSQQYQQLRSQATLLAVNALIYYDAQPDARPDKRHLLALQGAQQRLDALALQLNLPSRPLENVGEAAETRQKQARTRSLRGVNEQSEPVFNAVSATQVVFQQPASDIGDSLASLEAWLVRLQELPRDEAPRYPQLLIGLLDSRLQLDQQAAVAYQQTVDRLPPPTRLLNRQSLDIASLLLHAQARSARVLGDHSLAFAEAEFTARDQAIQQGFDELSRLLPEQADALHKQLLAYRFVRKRLLDRDPGQVIGGLERYLAGVVVELDRLAAANPGE
nr:hypothetical protein [uncultured Pseudomonas sp.]